MNPALASQLQGLRKQLDASPWLKWALLAIAVLLAVSIGQALESARIASQKSAIDAEVELKRIRALQGQEEWVARATETTRVLEALNAEIPPASTAGVAQAAVQSWLNGLVASAGDIQNARVNVDAPVALESPEGLLRIHATLSGGLPPRQAMNLLRQIESSTNLVLVESVDIRNDGNKAFSVSVNAYYRLAAAGGAP